jgi:hypothetical protein
MKEFFYLFKNIKLFKFQGYFCHSIIKFDESTNEKLSQQRHMCKNMTLKQKKSSQGPFL